MAKNISLLGADYPDVPAVVLPKSGGGSAMFVDADDVNNVENALAIVVNGNTAPKAITAGQYLFIKNHSTLATGGYHATANISSGGAVSGSNVAADADGISNAINSKMNSTPIQSSNISMNIGGIEGAYIGSENGFMIHLRIRTTNLSINNGQVLGVLSQQYTPSNAWSYIPLIDYDAGKPINGSIYLTSNGNLTYYGDNLSSKALYLSYMFFKN